MARWEIKNVKMTGVAMTVPDNLVQTTDIDLFSADEAVTFIDNVGIEKRYVAPEGVCASDLCASAAENLISDLNWNKEEIDILIFESVTGDYKTPPTSCILQERLGLPSSTFCMDIPMGCCGFMYAVNVAANMLSSGNVKKALLLVGDTATKMGSQKDKSRVPLFGDCGAAITLEYDPNAKPIIIEFNTLGSGHQALMTPHGGFRNPITEKSFVYEDFGNGIVRAPMHALINGMNVLAFAISHPPKSVAKFIDDYQIDMDYFLVHQANKMIVDRVVKKLKVDSAIVPTNLSYMGNTGGASIPSLMVTELREQLTTSNTQKLLMSSFGLGLTWGTMYMKTSNLCIPKLIKYQV